MSTSAMVSISDRWVRLLRSPLFTLVEALSGIAITFAPLFLYADSVLNDSPALKRVITVCCFALIYLVPFFYMAFARSIIRQIPRPNVVRGDA